MLGQPSPFGCVATNVGTQAGMQRDAESLTLWQDVGGRGSEAAHVARGLSPSKKGGRGPNEFTIPIRGYQSECKATGRSRPDGGRTRTDVRNSVRYFNNGSIGTNEQRTLHAHGLKSKHHVVL